MTIPGGYVAGDILTAANLNLLPAGKVGYAEVTANQTTISAVADLTSLTVTWTAVSARRYRTSFYANVEGSAAGVIANIYITDASNNIKAKATFTDIEAATEPLTLVGSVCETSLSGSTTRKLRGHAAGVEFAEISLLAAATYPAYILVEDIGPA